MRYSVDIGPSMSQSLHAQYQNVSAEGYIDEPEYQTKKVTIEFAEEDVMGTLDTVSTGRDLRRTRTRSKKLGKISTENVRVAKSFANLFETIIEQDKKVETRREVLCEIPDFEPFSKYQSIFKYEQNKQMRENGIMSSICLKKFLETNNLSVPAKDYLVLDSDRKLLFSQ